MYLEIPKYDYGNLKLFLAFRAWVVTKWSQCWYWEHLNTWTNLGKTPIPPCWSMKTMHASSIPMHISLTQACILRPMLSLRTHVENKGNLDTHVGPVMTPRYHHWDLRDWVMNLKWDLGIISYIWGLGASLLDILILDFFSYHPLDRILSIASKTYLCNV